MLMAHSPNWGVQVWLLYEASRQGVDPDEKEALLTQARDVLHAAAQVQPFSMYCDCIQCTCLSIGSGPSRRPPPLPPPCPPPSSPPDLCCSLTARWCRLGRRYTVRRWVVSPVGERGPRYTASEWCGPCTRSTTGGGIRYTSMPHNPSPLYYTTGMLVSASPPFPKSGPLD